MEIEQDTHDLLRYFPGGGGGVQARFGEAINSYLRTLSLDKITHICSISGLDSRIIQKITGRDYSIIISQVYNDLRKAFGDQFDNSVRIEECLGDPKVSQADVQVLKRRMLEERLVPCSGKVSDEAAVKGYLLTRALEIL